MKFTNLLASLSLFIYVCMSLRPISGFSQDRKLQSKDGSFANFKAIDENDSARDNHHAPLELSISCKNLAKKDLTSGSDPYCEISEFDRITQKWVLAGKTEKITDNQNPKFNKTFVTKWIFEEPKKLRFALRDSDGSTSEDLGYVDIEDGEIAASDNMTVTKKLILKGAKTKDDQQSEITITGSDLSKNFRKATLTVDCQAINLPKMDGIFSGGKADPYLEFVRIADKSEQVATTSQVIPNTKNPNWGKIDINLRKLCQGNPNEVFRIDLKDYNKDGNHQLIGSVQTSVNEILAGAVDSAPSAPNNSLKKTIHTAKKSANDMSKDRALILSNPKVDYEHTFLDYLQGGCQLGLCLYDDMTGSNGHPADPDSLHFSDPSNPNSLSDHERAIWAISQFLKYYDSDNLYPFFGFGAVLPNTTDANHCFSLPDLMMGNPASSMSALVGGVDNIIPLLKQAKMRVAFSGPTYFKKIVENATEAAKEVQKQGNYLVQLIITDGDINDEEATMKAIINAQKYPLSIIIVGVGEGGRSKFKIMDNLDGDKKESKIRALAKAMNPGTEYRDIVQFVKLNDSFPPQARFGSQYEIDLKMSDFTQKIMAELPGQLVSYMKSHGIVPRPKVKTELLPPPPYQE